MASGLGARVRRRRSQQMLMAVLVCCVLCRYVGNTYYNIYNKKACAAIHAHWTVAFAQVCPHSTCCGSCCPASCAERAEPSALPS